MKMNKLALGVGFLVALIGFPVISFAADGNSRNLKTYDKAGYTISWTTITFPFRPKNIEIVNYETSNVLEVSYQDEIFEVDPAVGAARKLESCEFDVIKLRAKNTLGTETVSAEVVADY